MSYPLIARKVATEPWALEPQTFRIILHALDNHVPGTPREQIEPVAHYRDEELYTDDDDTEEYLEQHGIAVIPVHGIIGKKLSWLELLCGGCDLNQVSYLIDQAVKDSRVRAIVLDIESPGGTCTGLPEITRKIQAADEIKPVYAYTDGVCASAAYWIAASCREILAAPSSHVGNVGCYIMVMDYSRWYEEAGIKHDPIVQGEFKLAGAKFKALTDQERAYFQAQVDKTADQFKAIIRARHEVDDENLEGQTFDGDDAFAVGMVDQLADDLAEAVDNIVLTLS